MASVKYNLNKLFAGSEYGSDLCLWNLVALSLMFSDQNILKGLELQPTLDFL